MNQPDQILTAIARDKLGIPTLETRKSDRFDFHDLAVWNIAAALKAAYDAGARAGGMPAVPKLLAALNRCAMLLADHDEQEGEEGDAYREAIAVIAEATTPRREP